MTKEETTKFLINLTTYLAKSKNPVIYVAGKVTGLPVEEYEAKFADAKKRLEKSGFHVLNPCEFITPGTNWENAMRIASTLLNMAGSIYLLTDWQESEGAKWEFNQAVKFGIYPIFEQQTI